MGSKTSLDPIYFDNTEEEEKKKNLGIFQNILFCVPMNGNPFNVNLCYNNDDNYIINHDKYFNILTSLVYTHL